MTEPTRRLATFQALKDRSRAVKVLVPVLVADWHHLALVLPSDAHSTSSLPAAAFVSPLFHSLPKEYPAVSLAVYLVPLLIPLPYQLSFTLLVAVTTVALLLSSDGLDRFPGWSRRAAIYVLLGTASVEFSRYDIFPAFAAFLAVEAARKASWKRAWVWAVLGGVLKLFPFLLLPGFAGQHARTGLWPMRRVVTTGMSLAAGWQVSRRSYRRKASSRPSSTKPTEALGSPARLGILTLASDPFHARWLFAYEGWEIIGRYQRLYRYL